MVNSGRKQDSETYVTLSEDPWPYEYLINALQFFSLGLDQLNSYLTPDFEPVLFHGSHGDFISGNALEAITSIFTDIMHVGLSIDEWINQPKLENSGLEDDFKSLYQNLSELSLDQLELKWPFISVQARSLLLKLDWPGDEPPEFTCEAMLNEYSYGAYGIVVSGKPAP